MALKPNLKPSAPNPSPGVKAAPPTTITWRPPPSAK